MSFIAPLKALVPSFLGYWIFMVILASGAWYLWTRLYTHFAFKWQGPVLVATIMTAYMVASTIVGFYQNDIMVAFEKNQMGDHRVGSAVSTPEGSSMVEVTAGQMKASFLKAVENLLANPEQITEENKKKLFSEYSALFVSNAEKQAYAQAIGDVYNCQRAFWQDALSAYHSKKEVKSELREDCETKSGAFFNRAKLVPQESVEQNAETISNLAGHKRVPASDGKMVTVTEEMIKRALDAQLRASQNVQKIFE